MDKRTLNMKELRALAYSMGSDLHEAWREGRKRENGTFEPRIKKSKDEKWNEEHGTDEVDIANTTFEDLPSNWQDENLEAAMVAINLVNNHMDILNEDDMREKRVELMASDVHDAWLGRNDWVYDKEYGDPNLAKTYEELSEEEKAKDRVQVEQAIDKIQAYFRGEIDINEIEERFGLEEEKKAIEITPFFAGKDGYNENLDQLVERMQKIKAVTGKEVVAKFGAFDVVISTEMGDQDSMIKNYMENINNPATHYDGPVDENSSQYSTRAYYEAILEDERLKEVAERATVTTKDIAEADNEAKLTSQDIKQVGDILEKSKENEVGIEDKGEEK